MVVCWWGLVVLERGGVIMPCFLLSGANCVHLSPSVRFYVVLVLLVLILMCIFLGRLNQRTLFS